MEIFTGERFGGFGCDQKAVRQFVQLYGTREVRAQVDFFSVMLKSVGKETVALLFVKVIGRHS